MCALLSGGGYAEKAAVPAGQVLPVPPGISLIEAASFPEVACTVWSTVFMMSRLSAGETFLVDPFYYNSFFTKFTNFSAISCLLLWPLEKISVLVSLIMEIYFWNSIAVNKKDVLSWPFYIILHCIWNINRPQTACRFPEEKKFFAKTSLSWDFLSVTTSRWISFQLYLNRIMTIIWSIFIYTL